MADADIAPLRPVGQTGGFLYFITEGDRGPIKIGWTLNPAQRLSTMQVGNPRPLRVLGMISCYDRVEREWHAQFAGLRLAGEWFKRSPELIAAIKDARTHSLAPFRKDGRTTRTERITRISSPAEQVIS